MSDAISVTFVELSKLDEVVKKPVSDMTDLEKWSVFFQYAPDPEHREMVNKIIESKEVLQVAGNLLMSISQNEQERAIFRSRKKFQTDMHSNWATAEDNGRKIGREEGRAEGLAEGRVEGKIEVAWNLLKINLPLDQIAIATGLTIEEVEHLRMDEGE